MQRIAYCLAIRRCAIKLDSTFDPFSGAGVDVYVAVAVGVKAHRAGVASADRMQIAGCVGLRLEDDRVLNVGRDGETLLGYNFRVLGRGGQAAQEDGSQREQAARALLGGSGQSAVINDAISDFISDLIRTIRGAFHDLLL